MKKKVLILSASPRRNGNSDLLCDQFGAGAQEAGNQVEKIYLRDKKINPCLACEACYTNGGVCAQKDDMTEILEKMVSADVIVMATPVYFYAMSAQMKILIDRTVPRYREMNAKEFYFIVTAADGDRKALERTVNGLRGFTDCLEGAVEKGTVYGTGVWKMGEVQGSPAMKDAYEMGKNI
jgi:multimeric flavodoxin WrbA